MRAHDAEKHELKPGLRKPWVSPPQANAEFVCAMAAVWEGYPRVYDPARPVVCLDEKAQQGVAETRTPVPAEPGQPEGVDYASERGGTANRFLTGEPLTGHRHVTVTARRPAVDFAQEVRDRLEVRYAHAERVVRVIDNLNTHPLAALDEAFAPAVARSRIDRLEVHHTPQQGSWLNMAEIERSVLSRQCRERRRPDADTLTQEGAAWEPARNTHPRPVTWRFTAPDARLKLKRLYPSIQDG